MVSDLNRQQIPRPQGGMNFSRMTVRPAEIRQRTIRILKRPDIDAGLLNVEPVLRKIPNQTLSLNNMRQGSRPLRHPIDRIAAFPPGLRQRSGEDIRTSK